MGDVNDDWRLECNLEKQYGQIKKEGDLITGKDLFFLKHAQSGCYLIGENSYRFNQQNCGRQCPIMNQLETSCTTSRPQKTSLFKIDSGFFFPPRDEFMTDSQSETDESSEGKINDEL